MNDVWNLNPMYQGFEEFIKAEVALQNECANSDDFKEGITAFLEKRKPDYSKYPKRP